MADFEKVQYVRQCCFSILPQLYCDRFSITEQIGKIVNALNKLIENNNKLEDYVKEIIREVIESGEIEEIIKDMLANYILNVKYPPEGIEPASGDGTKDDTLAIQGCIDYAFNHNGMAVYFPSGKYLTQSLNMKNNVTLCGFDSATTLVLKGGAINPLLSGNTFNNEFINLSFDGNADIQVNNVDVITLTGGRYKFNNVKITDGYNLLTLNQSDDVTLDNVSFGSAVVSALITNGDGLLNANCLTFKNLSTLSGLYAIDNKVNGAVFTEIYSTCNTVTAIRNTSNNSVFIGQILNATNTHANFGSGNYYEFYNRGGTTLELINNERTEREEADSDLLEQINREILNREEADSDLLEQINSETLNRTEADNLLLEKINQRIATYETVEAMKNDTNLVVGTIVEVMGFYTKNDGGSGFYEISNEASGFYQTLDNSLFAVLLAGQKIKAETLGCKPNDTNFDNAIIINKAIQTFPKLFLLLNSGAYYINTPIVADIGDNESFSVEGEGSINSQIFANFTNDNMITLNCSGWGNGFSFKNARLVSSPTSNNTGLVISNHTSSLVFSIIKDFNFIDLKSAVVLNGSRMIEFENVGIWSQCLNSISIILNGAEKFTGDLDFRHCQFSDIVGPDSQHLFFISGSGIVAGNHFTDCIFYPAKKYIFNALSDGGIQDTWFTNCAFDNTTPVTFNIEGSKEVTNFIIQGCYFTAPMKICQFYLTGTGKMLAFRFLNNYVIGNGGENVININPANDTMICGNSFINSISNSNSVVVALSYAKGAVVSNNSFTSTNPFEAKAYAIHGDSAISIGNISEGFTSEEVFDNHATTSLNTNNLKV